MSNELNTLIWSANYANSALAAKKQNNEEYNLLNVSLFKDHLQLIHSIIMNQKNICCMVADSHSHAYDFIREKWDKSKTRLYNVDFHHDTNPYRDEVHCGNWLRALLDEKIVEEAYWVNQPKSAVENNLAKIIPISELPRTGYDLVYICRSGWWTPPHLDEIFINQLAKPVIKNRKGWEVIYQQNILESRYNERFRELLTLHMDKIREIYDAIR